MKILMGTEILTNELLDFLGEEYLTSKAKHRVSFETYVEQRMNFRTYRALWINGYFDKNRRGGVSMEKKYISGNIVICDVTLRNQWVRFHLKDGTQRTFVIGGASMSVVGGTDENGKYAQVKRHDVLDYDVLGKYRHLGEEE